MDGIILVQSPLSRQWELEELACRVCGLSEKETEDFINEGTDLDELIYPKFSMGFTEFCSLAEALLKFTPKVQTAIEHQYIHAFVDGFTILLKEI